jgi:hypothetical protein
VVKKHRLDALLPLRVLLDQRVTQPHPGAEIKDVIRRDPGLRQPPRDQQLTMMASISAVGLRALLVATQSRGLRRLSQMRHRTNRPQLLDKEPPPRRRLQRDLQLLASKPRQEPPYPGTVRRADPRATDLTAIQIDPLRSDLRPMLVYAHHDRHLHQLPSSRRQRPAQRIPLGTVGAFC